MKFDDLPKIEAGCNMPSSHSIHMSDAARKLDAEEGSRMLLEAYLRYFDRERAEQLGGYRGASSLITACAVVREDRHGR